MNPESPQFRAHCERLIGLLPELANSLIRRTLNALRSPKGDLALAQDRQLVFGLTGLLQQHEHRFQEALSHRFLTEVTQARQARPRSDGSRAPLPSLNELSLVDESAAQTTIEVARTVQLVELVTEWSLRELQSYTSALRGDTDIRPESNPFSPAVFGRALSDAVAVLSLPNAERQLLLRVSGSQLADVLHLFYTEANLHLHQAGITPLEFKAVVQPHAHVPAHTDVTRPGGLDELLQRLPAANQMSSPMVTAALDRALQQIPLNPGGTQVNDPRVIQGLSQLLERMVQESASVPMVQPVVQQMQTSMIRLALQEPEIAEDLQHPSWQLINDLVSYVSGFRHDEAHEQYEFMAQIDPIIAKLAENTFPKTADFVQARSDIQQVIDAQSAELLESREAMLKALEEADHLETLKGLLQQQVEQHLEGHTVPIVVSDFLRGPWVEVMVKIMTQSDMDDAESHELINVVEDLVTSLQRPATLDERDRLRKMLPSLTERLRKGMSLINWPPKLRGDLMEQLMVVHARYLRSAPVPAEPPRELTPHEIVSQMRSEHIDSVWQHLNPDPEPQVDVDAMATVPMGLEDPEQTGASSALAAADTWASELRPGTWFKLSLHGEWVNARLIWVSRNQRFFMFTGRQADEIHTLPRHLLCRLRSEGLAAVVQQRSLVQRAADSLMGDLGD